MNTKLLAKKNGISRRALAILLAAVLLVSTFAAAFAADVISRPVVKAVSAEPKDAIVNEMVKFTITTDLAATKIRIANNDGQTYYIADIDRGFKDYVDSGDSRVWTITKKAQTMGKNTKLVYAGNYRVYSASGVNTDFNVYRNIAEKPGSGVTTTTSAGTTTTKPTTTTTTTKPTTTTTTSSSGEKVDPPHPFWKVGTIYTGGEMVYYKGKIYKCDWWAQGTPPDQLLGQSWSLVGNAEWTVPEDPKNYEDEEIDDPEIGVAEKLTDAEIESIWGGIDPRYTSEASVSRLEQCLPKAYYEELFPLRFGSAKWKTLTDSYYKGSQTVKANRIIMLMTT